MYNNRLTIVKCELCGMYYDKGIVITVTHRNQNICFRHKQTYRRVISNAKL